jgi:imidazolonepropionase-like amidohydrolase
MQTHVVDITGATLIDGTGAAPRPNAAIRIRDGVIEAVWGGDEPAPPAGNERPQVIDATGKYLVPGLIDTHCHISYGEGRTAEEVDVYGGPEWAAVRAVWNAQKVLASGVTSFCDCGSTWNVAVTCRDAIASGMFSGPRIYAAGRHIVSDGGFADYFPPWLGMPVSAEGVLCSTEPEMVSEVRRQVKQRVDLIKISGDSQAQDRIEDAGPCFRDAEMQAIVDTAHALGRKTTIHARYANTVVAAVRAGVDWIIHASYMRGQDIGFVRDSGIPICPTITFTANIVEHGEEAGVDPNYIEVKRRELDALAEIHRRAHEAGIPFMAGSEAGFSVTPYGEWHAREIELLVELLGLTPLEAVRAATSTNAAAMGWDDLVGAIKPGLRADILILNADPLADIGVLGRPDAIDQILKDGKPVDRTALSRTRRRMSHERGFTVSAKPLHRPSSLPVAE